VICSYLVRRMLASNLTAILVKMSDPLWASFSLLTYLTSPDLVSNMWIWVGWAPQYYVLEKQPVIPDPLLNFVKSHNDFWIVIIFSPSCVKKNCLTLVQQRLGHIIEFSSIYSFLFNSQDPLDVLVLCIMCFQRVCSYSHFGTARSWNFYCYFQERLPVLSQ
jgi:hypothetical protein